MKDSPTILIISTTGHIQREHGAEGGHSDVYQTDVYRSTHLLDMESAQRRNGACPRECGARLMHTRHCMKPRRRARRCRFQHMFGFDLIDLTSYFSGVAFGRGHGLLQKAYLDLEFVRKIRVNLLVGRTGSWKPTWTSKKSACCRSLR